MYTLTWIPAAIRAPLCAMAYGMASLAWGQAGAPAQDPPRWHIEDLTPQARYQTAKKEAGAAYQEALIECKQLHGTDRANCNGAARKQYTSDLERARLLLIPQ